MEKVAVGGEWSMWVWCMCDGVLAVWRESCGCVSDGRVRSHSVHVVGAACPGAATGPPKPL